MYCWFSQNELTYCPHVAQYHLIDGWLCARLQKGQLRCLEIHSCQTLKRKIYLKVFGLLHSSLKDILGKISINIFQGLKFQ